MTETLTSHPSSAVLEPMDNNTIHHYSGAQESGSGANALPNSAISHHSTASGISEASSKASSHLSKTSSSTSTTTANSSTNRIRSKAPSLDAIAARMKKVNTNEKGEGEAAEQDQNGESRSSRLPMPGRLHSATSENSDSSSTMMPPAPVARGEPPSFSRGRSENLASLRDKAANRSRSTSPNKQQALPAKASSLTIGDLTRTASGSSMSGKDMPSLQDIIDRMSKKGISNNSTKSNSNSNHSTNANASIKPTTTMTAEGTFKEPAKRSPSPVKSATHTKEGEMIKTGDSTKSKSSIISTQPKEDKGHPLQHKWTMYFDSKSWNPSTNVAAAANMPDTPGSPGPGATASTANSWEAALKMLGVYTSVESFMSIFSTLRRPSQLERNSNYHLFKNGIKPMWEDAANQNGGKWIITLKGTNSALLDRSWMWLVLALIGEELDDNDDITGAVVSTRSKGDRIALWIRNKNDVDLVNKIGKKFVLLLDLEKEPGVSLEFSPNSMDEGNSRKGLHGSSPSKFISFNNPATFTSPNFGAGAGQQQTPTPSSQHRINVSPGKFSGHSTSQSRIGTTRRGSEQSNDGSSNPFTLGGPIGRTMSPTPRNGNPVIGGSGLLGKAKMGIGMNPPN